MTPFHVCVRRRRARDMWSTRRSDACSSRGSSRRIGITSPKTGTRSSSAWKIACRDFRHDGCYKKKKTHTTFEKNALARHLMLGLSEYAACKSNTRCFSPSDRCCCCMFVCGFFPPLHLLFGAKACISFSFPQEILFFSPLGGMKSSTSLVHSPVTPRR